MLWCSCVPGTPDSTDDLLHKSAMSYNFKHTFKPSVPTSAGTGMRTPGMGTGIGTGTGTGLVTGASAVVWLCADISRMCVLCAKPSKLLKWVGGGGLGKHKLSVCMSHASAHELTSSRCYQPATIITKHSSGRSAHKPAAHSLLLGSAHTGSGGSRLAHSEVRRPTPDLIAVQIRPMLIHVIHIR